MKIIELIFYLTSFEKASIEKASLEKKEMIVMGDANLCSAKWKDPKFLHKKIVNQLIGCLEHCELLNMSSLFTLVKTWERSLIFPDLKSLLFSS